MVLGHGRNPCLRHRHSQAEVVGRVSPSATPSGTLDAAAIALSGVKVNRRSVSRVKSRRANDLMRD